VRSDLLGWSSLVARRRRAVSLGGEFVLEHAHALLVGETRSPRWVSPNVEEVPPVQRSPSGRVRRATPTRSRGAANPARIEGMGYQSALFRCRGFRYRRVRAVADRAMPWPGLPHRCNNPPPKTSPAIEQFRPSMPLGCGTDERPRKPARQVSGSRWRASPAPAVSTKRELLERTATTTGSSSTRARRLTRRHRAIS
jgi:hypothetical protein